MKKFTPQAKAKLFQMVEESLEKLSKEQLNAEPTEQIKFLAQTLGKEPSEVYETLMGESFLMEALTDLVEPSTQMIQASEKVEKLLREISHHSTYMEDSEEFFKFILNFQSHYKNNNDKNIQRAWDNTFWQLVIGDKKIDSILKVFSFKKTFRRYANQIAKALYKVENEDFKTDRIAMDVAPNLLAFGGERAYKAALEGHIRNDKNLNEYIEPALANAGISPWKESYVEGHLEDFLKDRVPLMFNKDRHNSPILKQLGIAQEENSELF